jgi:hypothetical protein
MVGRSEESSLVWAPYTVATCESRIPNGTISSTPSWFCQVAFLKLINGEECTVGSKSLILRQIEQIFVDTTLNIVNRNICHSLSLLLGILLEPRDCILVLLDSRLPSSLYYWTMIEGPCSQSTDFLILMAALQGMDRDCLPWQTLQCFPTNSMVGYFVAHNTTDQVAIQWKGVNCNPFIPKNIPPILPQL